MLNCYTCHNRLNPGDSVLLLCECLVSICQDCARDQLLRNELTYNSYIQCPACSHRVHASDGIFLGIADAMSQEDAIVRQALADTGVIHTDTSSPSFIKLQACLNRLTLDVDPTAPKDTREAPLAPRNGGVNRDLEFMLADMRLTITNLAMTRFDLPTHPVEAISFRRNRFLENYLVYLSANPDATMDSFRASPEALQVRQCSVCISNVAIGRSVLLTCQCNVIMCKACAMNYAAVHRDTYHEGITCSWCRQSARGVVGNLPYLESCEQELIVSAQTYLTDRLLVGPTDKNIGQDRFHLQTLRNMLRMYWCLGYSGDFREEHLLTLTERQVRYELARLEEMRLNLSAYMFSYKPADFEAGIYGKLPLGFLGEIDIRRNVFFEHLCLGATEDELLFAPAQSQPVFMEQFKTAMVRLKGVKINALDKLVLTAMYVHRDVRYPHEPFPFVHVDDVCEAFKTYLTNPMQKFSEHFNRDFTSTVIKRVTLAVMKKEVLRLLQSRGWVRQAKNRDKHNHKFCLAAADIFTLRGKHLADGTPSHTVDPGLLARAQKDFYITTTVEVTTAAAGAGIGTGAGAAMPSTSVAPTSSSASASVSSAGASSALLPAPSQLSSSSTKHPLATTAAPVAPRPTPAAVPAAGASSSGAAPAPLVQPLQVRVSAAVASSTAPASTLASGLASLPSTNLQAAAAIRGSILNSAVKQPVRQDHPAAVVLYPERGPSHASSSLSAGSVPAAALAPPTSATAAPRPGALSRPTAAISHSTVAAEIAQAATVPAPAPARVSIATSSGAVPPGPASPFRQSPVNSLSQVGAESSSLQGKPTAATAPSSAGGSMEVIDLAADSDDEAVIVRPGRKRSPPDTGTSIGAEKSRTADTAVQPAAKKPREGASMNRVGDPAATAVAWNAADVGAAAPKGAASSSARVAVPMPPADRATIDIPDSSEAESDSGSDYSSSGDSDGNSDGDNSRDGDVLNDAQAVAVESTVPQDALRSLQSAYTETLTENCRVQAQVCALNKELSVVSNALGREKGKHKKTIERMTERYIKLRDELETFKGETHAQGKSSSAVRAEAARTVRDAADANAAALAKVEQERDHYFDCASNAEQERDRYLAEVSTLRAAAEANAAAMGALQQERNRFADEVKALRAAVREQKESADASVNARERVHRENDRLARELQRQSELTVKHSQETAALRDENERLKRQLAVNTSAPGHLIQGAYQEMSEANARMQTEVSKLTRERQALCTQLSLAHENLRVAATERYREGEESAGLRAEIQLQQVELQRLQTILRAGQAPAAGLGLLRS